jgi:hypothetical protein
MEDDVEDEDEQQDVEDEDEQQDMEDGEQQEKEDGEQQEMEDGEAQVDEGEADEVQKMRDNEQQEGEGADEQQEGDKVMEDGSTQLTIKYEVHHKKTSYYSVENVHKPQQDVKKGKILSRDFPERIFSLFFRSCAFHTSKH